MIESYFKDCEQRGVPPFITELAVWLDTSRETLIEYQERPEFVDTIKRAKQRCELAIEKGIMMNKLNTVAGIFNLKNNYGWRDKRETEHSGNIGYVITEGDSEDQSVDTSSEPKETH